MLKFMKNIYWVVSPTSAGSFCQIEIVIIVDPEWLRGF